MTFRAHHALIAATAVFTFSACTANAGLSAENYITDELQDQIGLGDLDATCTQPAELKAGETFTCTATADDGRVVKLIGEMTDSDTFDLNTTNLYTAADIDSLRAEGARVLSPVVGVTINPDDIACPDEVIVVDDTNEFHCEITDSATGEVFDLLVSTDPDDVSNVNFSIGDQLR